MQLSFTAGVAKGIHSPLHAFNHVLLRIVVIAVVAGVVIVTVVVTAVIVVVVIAVAFIVGRICQVYVHRNRKLTRSNLQKSIIKHACKCCGDEHGSCARMHACGHMSMRCAGYEYV